MKDELTEAQKIALWNMHLPRIKEMHDFELVNRIIIQSRMTNMDDPLETYFLKMFKIELLQRLRVRRRVHSNKEDTDRNNPTKGGELVTIDQHGIKITKTQR